ncbi:nucleoid-associated protein [Hominifimenecus sp. rT4P-3]|uniref:nucleoid-associated protein n=1 Tax=Hominifimenecus sp. rT4P-3 TaxID=3242979 RepID=UPI003DA4B547
MKQEEIQIKAGVVHILDSDVGMPVLSDCAMEIGSDFSDFLKGHIERFTESDEKKLCRFAPDSEVGEILRECTEANFVETSQLLAKMLYRILYENPAIPSADAILLWMMRGEEAYLAFLKMDYKTSYTHITNPGDEGNSNEIILQKALLPSKSQRLSEAFLVRLSDLELQLVEKRYEINGEKCWYFSEKFLQCQAPMSQKAKLDVVTKAVEQVNRKYYGEEDTGRRMEIKNVIYKELEEEGGLRVEAVKEKVFSDRPQMQAELEEKLEKYHLSGEVVAPKSEQTLRKFQKQHLTTDTGIEITIPMEEYENPERVEFLTNPDGTISVLIKNVGKLSAK